MKIAVLFDGAGLARLGLEQAGHECIGVEKDPLKHYLSTLTGSGNCVLSDVLDFTLSEFDGVWASPPCQLHSKARTQGLPTSDFANDLLDWALQLDFDPLWVENVTTWQSKNDKWGTLYNAGQFLQTPIQNRNRILGGRYSEPEVFRPYQRVFEGICPTILASEYKGSSSDKRRASKYYGRKLTLAECAYHQGLPQEILLKWLNPPLS